MYFNKCCFFVHIDEQKSGLILFTENSENLCQYKNESKLFIKNRSDIIDISLMIILKLTLFAHPKV